MKIIEFPKTLLAHWRHASHPDVPVGGTQDSGCTEYGTAPMTTVEPVTLRPHAHGGSVLSFEQSGVTRYACLNLPRQADEEASRTAGYKWPLFIHLHGSRTAPGSLYSLGKNLFALHDTWQLSSDPRVRGFILLSPEGRRANPPGALSGKGFHWDEWYRNPSDNLDALAVDHFLDEVVAMGRVDTSRIYVFGWSNGAYMAALYGVWRSHRIAGIAQYAGADPWSRAPCPVPLQYSRQVPLVLLRNLCDALVPCSTTSSWIQTLEKLRWPFAYYNLDVWGHLAAPDRECDPQCSKLKGLFEHVRWPKTDALEAMLGFLKRYSVP